LFVLESTYFKELNAQSLSCQDQADAYCELACYDELSSRPCGKLLFLLFFFFLLIKMHRHFFAIVFFCLNSTSHQMVQW
jgi:hypothetical protein